MTAAATMITEGEAYLVTYGALVVFAVVVGIAVPSLIKTAKDNGEEGADMWYSARNTQGFLSIGLSVFASSMGAWVLFAAPEVGAGPGSWWGVIGYALASTLPFAFYGIVGPIIRRRFPGGFCLVDWVQERFGRPTQVYVGLVSVFYMWIYLVAELTSMGNLISQFSGLDPLSGLIPVSVVTMIYTSIGGLKASIWTDRVQGVIMVFFILLAVIACFSGSDVKKEDWTTVSELNDKGFEALVTLIFAILGAELFNMSSWQRVYAAEDETQLRRGLALGMSLIFPTMILFGVAGMVAKAQHIALEDPESVLFIPAYGFFDLLGSQSGWVQILSYCLATCMVASSVDSLQTGLVSVLSHEIMKRKMSPMTTSLLGIAFLVTVNVAAIILAAESAKDVLLGLNILDLFLIADLLTLSILVPIFSGLGSLATQNGALAGCFSGLLFIMAFGWLEFGTFMAGLEMMTLMAFGNIEPPESGLTASRTSIIFFMLPIVTGVVTFGVSWMERMLNHFEKLALKSGSGDCHNVEGEQGTSRTA